VAPKPTFIVDAIGHLLPLVAGNFVAQPHLALPSAAAHNRFAHRRRPSPASSNSMRSSDCRILARGFLRLRGDGGWTGSLPVIEYRP
jgi:hypothetical protein